MRPRLLSAVLAAYGSLCACAADSDSGLETDAHTDASDDGTAVGRFPCGNFGGTCRVGYELCIVEDEDMCSRCIELEEPCYANQDCSCIDDLEAAVEGECLDAPRCEQSGGGLVVRCAADAWTCG